MTTQYTTILKLALPVQGELSGTWGDVVNDNITQMVEQAVAGKAVVNTWTGNSHTLTTADGTTSESRCAILELTDTGTALTGAGTVVCPTNTKLYIVDNNTAEIITVQTAAGTGVAVPVGKTMLVYCDGTNVVEGVTHANSLSLGTSTVTADKILDEDNMASDSATAIATQQSIKAYVDSQVGTVDTLSEILANGNTTGANDIDVDSAQKVQFRDAAIYLNSSVDGQLDIVADTEIQIAATTIDVNGTLAFDSLKGTGATTVTNILDEDNMASDSATAIATQQSIKAYVDSQVGSFDTLAEVLAQGNTTGGTDLAVSTGDDITFADNSKAIFGAGSDLQIYSDGTTGQVTGNVNVTGAGTFSDEIKVTGGTLPSAVYGLSTVSGLSTGKLTSGGASKASSITTYYDDTYIEIVAGVSAGYMAGISLGGRNYAGTGGDAITLSPRGVAALTLAGATGAATFSSSVTALKGIFTQTGGDFAATFTTPFDYVAKFESTDSAAFIVLQDNNSTDNANRIGVVGNSLEIEAGNVENVAFTSAGPVFNEAGADIDFRVESDGNANMLFVDGGTNRVGIGVGGPPEAALHIQAAANGGGIGFYVDTNTRTTGETYFYLGRDVAPNLTIDTSENITFNGSTVFNEASAVVDFRVESDSNANMLFVDGTNNRVGIGQTPSSSPLDVKSPDASTAALVSTFRAGGDNDDNRANIFIGQADNSRGMLIRAGRETGDRAITQFILNGSGGTIGSNIINFLEAYEVTGSSDFAVTINQDGENVDFRVESDTNANSFFLDASAGFICIGRTSASETTGVYGAIINSTGSTANVRTFGDGTHNHFQFISSGAGVVGSIVTTASGTTFNTSSDQRLKENITNADDAGSKIDAIQVRQYDWKVDGSHQDYGMIAQELQAVAPEAVSGDADSEEMMGVDYSTLVPMLIKEIQSLRARVADLES